MWNRRGFLGGLAGAASPALLNALTERRDHVMCRFLTPECEGKITVQFLNRYAGKGFLYHERSGKEKLCLSLSGMTGQTCLSKFYGSMAIALYHLQSRPNQPPCRHVRELVTTIDQDGRMRPRPPFEKVVEIVRGTISDVQAFGYGEQEAAEISERKESIKLWCLLRQELYFDRSTSPFLIVHWKHTFEAITLVDCIPGDGTQLLV